MLLSGFKICLIICYICFSYLCCYNILHSLTIDENHIVLLSHNILTLVSKCYYSFVSLLYLFYIICLYYFALYTPSLPV